MHANIKSIDHVYVGSGGLPALRLGDDSSKGVRELEWRKEDGLDALPNLVIRSVR